MGYAVKEIYYTLQGEGANTGRPAVFCRFTGCNLWSGREQDRSSAVCQFCDTDFVGTDGPGGGRFESAAALAEAVAACWPRNEVDADAKRTHDAGAGPRPMVVCTGGESLLQLDAALIEGFHALGFEVAIETNGTKPVPHGVDWVCVSPKAGAPLVVEGGDELKLVYPQAGAPPEDFVHLSFTHRYLQPMDGPARESNTAAASDYCLRHPAWRLSLQTHKLIGIR